MDEPYAEALAPDRSDVVLNTGEVVRLTTFLDGQDETDDPMEAHAGVGRMADGRWITVEFRHFSAEARN